MPWVQPTCIVPGDLCNLAFLTLAIATVCRLTPQARLYCRAVALQAVWDNIHTSDHRVVVHLLLCRRATGWSLMQVGHAAPLSLAMFIALIVDQLLPKSSVSSRSPCS